MTCHIEVSAMCAQDRRTFVQLLVGCPGNIITVRKVAIPDKFKTCFHRHTHEKTVKSFHNLTREVNSIGSTLGLSFLLKDNACIK